MANAPRALGHTLALPFLSHRLARLDFTLFAHLCQVRSKVRDRQIPSQIQIRRGKSLDNSIALTREAIASSFAVFSTRLTHLFELLALFCGQDILHFVASSAMNGTDLFPLLLG